MPNDEFLGTILRMGSRDRYALVEADSQLDSNFLRMLLCVQRTLPGTC